jgi:hypothetical protein
MTSRSAGRPLVRLTHPSDNDRLGYSAPTPGLNPAKPAITVPTHARPSVSTRFAPSLQQPQDLEIIWVHAVPALEKVLGPLSYLLLRASLREPRVVIHKRTVV